MAIESWETSTRNKLVHREGAEGPVDIAMQTLKIIRAGQERGCVREKEEREEAKRINDRYQILITDLL